MFDLTGKTALVTGASGGIGGAVARALHGAGATVALSGTRTGPLEALAAELAERAHVLTCDLSDAASVEALPEGGGGGDGVGRRAGEQCGHHAGQPLHADVGRGMDGRAGGQSHLHLPALPGGCCGA